MYKNIADRDYSIEFLRFFAAMAVVFMHMPGIGFGRFGVDIFFIISGFVMMLSTEMGSENFFLKRIIRVVPTYYIFTLGVFFIALIYPNFLNNTTADFIHLFKSFLFVPFDKNGIGHYPIMFLGWTLNYEMYFYALFALSLKISVSYRDIVTTVLISCIYLLTQSTNSLPLSAYSSNVVFEFVIGMAIYRALVNKNNLVSIFLLAIISVSFFISNDFSGRFYQLGIGSAFFCFFMLIFLSKLRLPKLIATLGGYSYALYLTHPYIIQAFDKILGWFDLSIYYWISAVMLSLVFVNLFAFMIWRALEIPLTSYLRKKFI